VIKVAIIARSTFYTVPGGDTIQAVQTVRHLVAMGVDAAILLTNQIIAYEQYDLLHFFNLIRPADILYHSKKSGKPFVVSTILCNYGEYDKHHRKKTGLLFSHLPADSIEYLKTMARWLLGRDHLSGISYIWKGQRRSIIDILRKTAMVLPNSQSEYERVVHAYAEKIKHMVVPNGVDTKTFTYDPSVKKDDQLVLCVARIEGIKNQLNLVKALNNTRYRLLIIGSSAPNQMAYYRECRAIAASNVTFIEHVPQHELVKYYQQARVHILPSWFETTGLSSIEAAVMGCSIVITDRGDAKEYFGDDAFYCEPGSPQSIRNAIDEASRAGFNHRLASKIHEKYTWTQAAIETLKAYKTAIAQ
jgi:glycosyltransferase involved in cell wall biosynthesis